MIFRKILISVGCLAAAVGIGSAKPARAGDLQQGNESAANPFDPCNFHFAGNGGPSGCDRIGGHVRVEAVPRIPDTVGFGGPSRASPVAVRIDGGASPRGHLHLPAGLDDQPIPR